MITNPHLKYAYIPVTKTACSAIQQWLRTHYGGVRSPSTDDRDVPEWAETVFTVVRHPVERMVSMWWYLTQSRAKTPINVTNLRDPKTRPRELSFERFMYLLVSSSQIDPSYVSQTEFLEGVPLSHVVPYERLPDGLKMLPFFDPGMPPPARMNVIPDRPVWEKVVTPVAMACILEHSLEDFEEYGYSVFPPPTLKPRGNFDGRGTA